MVAEAVRGAVEWVVAALSGAVTAPEEVAGRLSPRLAARGDLTGFLTANRRFAAFREHQAVIEGIETPGPWTARAAVRTGPLLWELDVAVEPEPPYLIRSFQPRPVPPDAVPWTRIAASLRTHDRVESALPAPAARRIHERLLHAVETHRIVGLAAAIGVGAETVHRETLGVADLQSRTPLDDKAVFRVGSVTKAVTALGVLRLAETGAVDPDGPIDAYVASPVLVPPAPGGRTPTVAELLLHRGGLPKDLAVSRAPLLAGTPLAQVAPRIDMAWPAGERPEYSNVGYAILGALIEAVSGDAYADFCSREVLPRFGMTSACVQRPGVAAPATVTGHRVAAGHVSPAPPAVAPYPAAGGMTAGVDDLLALAGAFGRATDPLVRTALAMAVPAGPGTRFAPGVALLDRPAGTLVWRAGATDGFTAEVLATVDGSVRVVLAAAKSPPDGLRAVGLDLIGRLAAA
ncbi:CubicO group peptidase, beta-lactamase class C family [Actinacidiphila yanglinensis]|uniref:CubicO group peptidase, beta-lactamase class C family n=1 Tax=Actinacidiphila yanglinensis TaxID=310779 RepID=A0A1H6AN41_9ACTN|nr:serine hydrolase domain-containing protein [Actinacidiphila yanglinensis]SEG49600.1 CubicO group peptidase, beta-lactamase class C family [Actinacidiphila yanglinensis]